MRTSSLAAVAAIVLTSPIGAGTLVAQGETPLPPPAAPRAPRAPVAPTPPRAPMPGERVRIIRRGFMDDSAFRNRPTLGMTLSATGTIRDTLGVFVMRVVPGGPAERAGIIEGDRIASIDDVSLKTNAADVEDPYAAGLPAHRVSRTVMKLTPGKTVALRVYHDGRYRAVTVTAGKIGDVYKDHARFMLGMEGLGGEMMPMLENIGPMMATQLAPAMERIGPMMERMGPVIEESIERSLDSLPRHIKIDIDDAAAPPPPPSRPKKP